MNLDELLDGEDLPMSIERIVDHLRWAAQELRKERVKEIKEQYQKLRAEEFSEESAFKLLTIMYRR